MKDRVSYPSGFVIGFIRGTEWLGYDVLNKMGKPISVGIDLGDMKSICKFILLKRYEIEQDKAPTELYLSVITRIHYTRINGYTWEEIQRRVKEIQRKLGLTKKKKY